MHPTAFLLSVQEVSVSDRYESKYADVTPS